MEGRTFEIGGLRLQVRSSIAQGSFSFVYLAKCQQTGRSYALKHIICSDPDTIPLVQREIDVMTTLRGHPNIVSLHSSLKLDNGRATEFFLVMEYCEKMLVTVMDARNRTHYDEKQVLMIFRDVCEAVQLMHSQRPPIAHR